MTLIEKIFSLKSTQCFERLDYSDLVLISDIARDYAYAPGEKFCEPGHVLTRLYVITDGSIQNDTGKVMPVILGPASLLFDIPVTERLLASPSKGARCLIIGKGHFFTIIHQRPSLLCGFLEMKDFEVRIPDDTNQIP